MTTETIVDVDLKREYSAEEFARLEDDGNRYELIEGKLVMSPATGHEHGQIAKNLYNALLLFLLKHSVGDVWFTTGFYLGKKSNGKDNVPEPDLGFIVSARIPAVEDKYLPYPDLAVEVWSRKSDLGGPVNLKKARKKLQMYLDAGTSIAWGINPITQEVEVHYKDPARPTRILTANDELDGEDLIPGFKLPVWALFS